MEVEWHILFLVDLHSEFVQTSYLLHFISTYRHGDIQ